MDPLSAFSLACGVIQVVDFGLQVVSTARDLYKDGSNKNYDQLSEISKDFIVASSKLHQSLATTNAQSMTVVDRDDKALYELSKKCNDTAVKLRDELDKLTVTATGKSRVLQAGVKTLLGFRKAGKLKDLGSTLEAYRRALDTQILVSLRLV